MTEQNQPASSAEVSSIDDLDFDSGYREARTGEKPAIESGAEATDEESEATAKTEAATEPAETVQSDEADGDDESDEDDDVELPRGVKKKVQREIDKAVRLRKEAEEFLAEARKAVSGNGNPGEAKTGAQPTETTPADKPEPVLDDYVVRGVVDGTYADYDAAYAAFTKDLTTHTYDARKAADDDARLKSEAEEASRQAWASRVAPVKEKYPDYDAVLAGPEVKVNDAVLFAVTSHPAAPELIYHLVRNPGEAQKLNQLGSIGEVFEAVVDFKNRYITPAKPSTPPRSSTAPSPISPVGGTRAGAVKSIRDLDYDDGYRAARSKQRR